MLASDPEEIPPVHVLYTVHPSYRRRGRVAMLWLEGIIYDKLEMLTNDMDTICIRTAPRILSFVNDHRTSLFCPARPAYTVQCTYIHPPPPTKPCIPRRTKKKKRSLAQGNKSLPAQSRFCGSDARPTKLCAWHLRCVPAHARAGAVKLKRRGQSLRTIGTCGREARRGGDEMFRAEMMAWCECQEGSQGAGGERRAFKRVRVRVRARCGWGVGAALEGGRGRIGMGWDSLHSPWVRVMLNAVICIYM